MILPISAMYKVLANSHDADRYEYVSVIFLGILMLGRVSKSARYLAIATCIAGLNGCSSDGGLGELATLAALGGSMVPGMDSGTVMALGTVAAGTMVVAPLLSDDSSRSASTAPAVPATTNDTQTSVAPTTVTVAAPPVSQSTLGVEVETLSTSMGTAVGLKPAEGALVIATTKGGTGDKGGLKALDVIVEVSGQVVADTASLQAIVGKMRTGYKAPVRVWRGHAFKDLTVEVAARGATLVAEAQPPRQDAVKSAPSSTAIAPVVATPRIEFCYVRMAQWGNGSHPNVYSEVFQDPHVSETPQSMIAVTRRYAETVSAQQPGIWSNFDYLPNQCVPSAGDCYAAINSWFTTNQAVHLFCRYSRADAEAELAGEKRLYTTATTINIH